MSILETIVAEKLHKEVWTSGCMNTPEPEELTEIKASPPCVKANSDLHSIKAKLQRRGGNPTFHKYTGDLWSIRASRPSPCALCADPIERGQEITLFNGRHGWAHMSHAVDQPTSDRKLEYP